VSGREGKFAIKVAKEGTTWSPPDVIENHEGQIGDRIEIDTLDKHTFSLEKMQDGKVALSIEDSINRLTSEFVNPKYDGKNSLHADPVKGLMMKGPELALSISDNIVRIDIRKGKKPMFAEDLQMNDKDSKKLFKYLEENFIS
jgi:hypothetical protein